MAIPTFQEITLPLLTLASDGQVRSLATARKELDLPPGLLPQISPGMK